MKDLDFEELDRAVNSMIGAQPTNGVGVTQGVNVATTSFANAPFQPTVNSVDTVNVTPAPVASVPVNRPVRPSSGRFMDMVRSNSGPEIRIPLAMPARDSVKPQPISTPVVTAASQTAATPIAVPVTPTEFVAPVAAPQPVVFDDNHDADIDQISLDIENTINELNGPQESPFLSGAKIEKRPLNAFIEEAPKPEMPINPVVLPSPVLTTTTEVKQPVAAVNTAVNTAPSNVNPIMASASEVIIPAFNRNSISDDRKLAQLDTPLPAELQSDILSIESNENLQMTDYDESPTPVVVAAQPVVATTAVDVPANTSANPVVATSIQQQYVEKPNSGEKVNVSIYDTKSYHKAMDGNKNKKGFMFVVWIVLLAAASIGAGVVVYAFVLPNL